MYIKPPNTDDLTLTEYLAEVERWQKDYQKLYNQYLRQTFDLVYYGRFSPEYVETLTPMERIWFINHLNSVKEKEYEEIKNAGKKGR